MPLIDWTMKHRRFNGVPPSIPQPLEAIYRDMHPNVVVLKAAQVTVSEYGINKTLWAADQGYADRGVALYVFPKQEQMDDFSQDRVQRAINGSQYLKERAGNSVSGDSTNRTRLRKIGRGTTYWRGSESESQTRAIDADSVVLDEVDLFVPGEPGKPGAIERTRERLGYSKAPLFTAFSQPKYPGGPIDTLWQDSDQRHYYLKCEHCNHQQALTWEANISWSMDYSDIKVVCSKCKRDLDRLATGEWIAHNPGAYSHGYHISKLYSSRANLREMLEKFLNPGDPEKIQSFWNADLGLPYRPQGTPGIEQFFKDYYQWNTPLTHNFFGCDVGAMLHVTILGRDHPSYPLKLMCREACSSFEEVETLWQLYNPEHGVIDGQGDPRATLEWASKHPGRVERWFHRPSAFEPVHRGDEIHYHRTPLLDRMYTTLKGTTDPQTGKTHHPVVLHSGAGAEFYKHLEANIREIVADGNGRLVPRYMRVGPNDYSFALAFAILASGVGPGTMVPSIIERGARPTLPSGAEEPNEGAGKWGGWGTVAGGSWRRWGRQ